MTTVSCLAGSGTASDSLGGGILPLMKGARCSLVDLLLARPSSWLFAWAPYRTVAIAPLIPFRATITPGAMEAGMGL